MNEENKDCGNFDFWSGAFVGALCSFMAAFLLAGIILKQDDTKIEILINENKLLNLENETIKIHDKVYLNMLIEYFMYNKRKNLDE